MRARFLTIPEKLSLTAEDADGEDDIPQMPVELDLLDKLKARVQLAKKIDSAAHRTRKEKHDKNWLKDAADAMEIELDSDLDRGYGRLSGHAF